MATWTPCPYNVDGIFSGACSQCAVELEGNVSYLWWRSGTQVYAYSRQKKSIYQDDMTLTFPALMTRLMNNRSKMSLKNKPQQNICSQKQLQTILLLPWLLNKKNTSRMIPTPYWILIKTTQLLMMLFLSLINHLLPKRKKRRTIWILTFLWTLISCAICFGILKGKNRYLHPWSWFSD